MKNICNFRRLIAFLVVFFLISVPVFAETEPIVESTENPSDASVYGCFSVDATDTFLGEGRLVKNAQSVLLYEMNTRTLMYVYEPDRPMQPTSFAKLLTAIVAIENAPLDSAVTVTETSLEGLPGGAVSAKLVANEVITLQDLLYCMLVGSANDAAAVIAHYIAGDQLRFAQMMNKLATDIGCTSSNFTNPHGFHDDAQMTTARDTAKILEYAMQNEVFRTIFTATEYTVPATNKTGERYLMTGNYMMPNSDRVQIYLDDRVIGGRTGVANDGGRCLATIARVGHMDLMCVVMGAASVYEEGGNKIRSYGGYNETKTLLDAGFNGNTAAQVLYDGQALIQLDVTGGDTTLTVGPRTNLSTVLPENLTLDDLTFRYGSEGHRLQAPIRAGDKVCDLEIWYDELCLAVTDLYAMNDVRDTSVIQPDVKTKSTWIPWVITICCILAVSTGLAIWLRTPSGKRSISRIIRRFRRRKKGSRRR